MVLISAVLSLVERPNRCAIAAIFFVLCNPPCAYSEVEYAIVADGSENTFEIKGATEYTLSLLFTSDGRDTSAVIVGIDGPPGLSGDVLNSKKRLGDPELLPAPEMLGNPIMEISGSREYASFEIDPTSRGGVIQFKYFLQKDACDRDESPRYLSRIRLDFSRVAKELVASGFTVRVAVQEQRYQGSRIASIKPASDGKYRGEPILLMASTHYGGERVEIIKHTASGVRLRRRIPVVKYVSHRGHMLSLARLRGLLSGGRATFQLSSASAVYAVCFQLERRRQRVHGYPL